MKDQSLNLRFHLEHANALPTKNMSNKTNKAALAKFAGIYLVNKCSAMFQMDVPAPLLNFKRRKVISPIKYTSKD